MAEGEDRSVSRRKLLGGLGTFAGASLVVGARSGAAAPAAESPAFEGLPTIAPPGYVHPEGVIANVAPAINPAWTYRTLGWDAFFSQTPVATTVDLNGLHAPTDATFFAPVELPQGALLREATFFVYNASPTTGLAVGVAISAPPTVILGGAISFSQANALVHTVTISNFDIFNPVDNTSRGYALE